MKLNLKSEKTRSVELQVGGESHTLLNLLQSFLLTNKNVEMAGYSKPHPLMDRSVLYVNMRGKSNPSKALIKAAKDAKKELNVFLNKFEDQVAKVKN
jgi:DNA-directed RNA polymerase subunit L